jgi:hypothetical protein
MAEVIDMAQHREERWTRQQVEDHLATEVLHWLPSEGETGDSLGQRTRAARAAAKIIASRLTAGKSRSESTGKETT